MTTSTFAARLARPETLAAARLIAAALLLEHQPGIEIDLNIQADGQLGAEAALQDTAHEAIEIAPITTANIERFLIVWTPFVEDGWNPTRSAPLLYPAATLEHAFSELEGLLSQGDGELQDVYDLDARRALGIDVQVRYAFALGQGRAVSWPWTEPGVPV